jgi:hypothetical protein
VLRLLNLVTKRKTVPVGWENDETQSSSGRLEEEKQLLPLLGFEPLIVQLVSQSLYQMSYPGSSTQALSEPVPEVPDQSLYLKNLIVTAKGVWQDSLCLSRDCGPR